MNNPPVHGCVYFSLVGSRHQNRIDGASSDSHLHLLPRCVCIAPALSTPQQALSRLTKCTFLSPHNTSTSASNAPLAQHAPSSPRKPQPSLTPWISSIDIVTHDFHPVSAATGPQLNHPVTEQPQAPASYPFTRLPNHPSAAAGRRP